jgi:hypothetical protein
LLPKCRKYTPHSIKMILFTELGCKGSRGSFFFFKWNVASKMVLSKATLQGSKDSLHQSIISMNNMNYTHEKFEA